MNMGDGREKDVVTSFTTPSGVRWKITQSADPLAVKWINQWLKGIRD